MWFTRYHSYFIKNIRLLGLRSSLLTRYNEKSMAEIMNKSRFEGLAKAVAEEAARSLGVEKAPEKPRMKNDSNDSDVAARKEKAKKTAKRLANRGELPEVEKEFQSRPREKVTLDQAKERLNTAPGKAEVGWLIESSNAIQHNSDAALFAAKIAEAPQQLRDDPYYLLAEGARFRNQTRWGDLSTEAYNEAHGLLDKLFIHIKKLATAPDSDFRNVIPERPNDSTLREILFPEARMGMTAPPGAPSAGDGAPKFVDPSSLSSEWGRNKAEEIKRRFERDPDILNSADDLRKIRAELGKEANVPPEAEEDLGRIIQNVRQIEVNASSLGLNRELKTNWENIKTNQRNARRAIVDIYDQIEKSAQIEGKKPPSDIESLFGDLKHATASSASPAELQHRADALSGQLSAGAKEAINTLIQAVREEVEFNEHVKDIGADRRLEMAGIKDKELLGIYDLVGDVKKFMRRLEEEGGDPARIQEYYEQFSGNLTKLSRKLLSVADTDQEEFFDHLFTQFYHQPVYNNIVSGISEIQKFIQEQERKGIIRKVSVREFNYVTQEYDENKVEDKKIKLSEALHLLQEKISSEREWVSYSHNLYVLMLNRAPLETYKDYTKKVKTPAIDVLLTENPELERAIRLHVGYLRTQYGLNGWKTPVESIYTMDPKTREIPIDAYVAKNLQDVTVPDGKGGQRPLDVWEIDRLAALAKGYVLGVSWEAIDAMASGGPVAGMPGQFTGFFGPLNNINFNRFVMYRWGSEFPVHEYLYTRVRGRGSNEGWNVDDEMARAKDFMERRKNKEPERIVTDQMVKDGIPFIEDTYYLGAGGLNARWGWRKQMYDHLIEGKAPSDYVGRLKELMTVDLFVANRYIEDWVGEGKINKDKRNELREMVLERMRQIAPQEFLILENDLLTRPALAGFSAKEIGSLVLEANKVTDYLLEHTRGGKTMILGDLTPEMWREIFPNLSLDSPEFKRIQTFIAAAQEVGTQAIFGVKFEGVREGKKEKFKIPPWREAAYIRSFPTHLAVKRNGKWSVLKENVVDRMAGDNDVLGKAYEAYWMTVPDIMKQYQADPEKAKQEKFRTYTAELAKITKAYVAVHGPASPAEERASAYRICYQLAMLFDKYYAKSVTARLPLTIGTMVSRAKILSSWSRYAVGERMVEVLQFDEQIHRVFKDELVKLQLIAPAHGRIPNSDNVKKFGPFRYGFKFDKLHWNAANFARESGGRNWQVAIDILRSYVPLVILLVMLSALGKSLDDSNKAG